MGIGISTTPTTVTTTSGGLSGLSDDKFEEYRKSKSYTYSRDPNGRRRREPIGCYRCGKVNNNNNNNNNNKNCLLIYFIILIFNF